MCPVTQSAEPERADAKPAPPRRVANLARRSREHLTFAEVERLIDAAGKVGRHRARDATLILIAYRHGLRVSELVDLRWEQVDFECGTLHVRRKKNGDPATHPLSGRELRALRELKRAYSGSPFLFLTERLGPITAATVRKLIARAGTNAQIGLPLRYFRFNERLPSRRPTGRDCADSEPSLPRTTRSGPSLPCSNRPYRPACRWRDNLRVVT